MAKWLARVLGAPVLALGALAACSNFGLLDAEIESLVTVANLPEGGYLRAQEPVTVQIASPPRSEDVLRMTVRVLDEAETELWSAVVEAPALNVPLEIDTFYDLLEASGVYVLELELELTDGSRSQERVTFFHALGKYQIVNINSFPPVAGPDTVSLLQATIIAPDGADPYLRWQDGETTLLSGLLSEGADRALWATPASQGIYSIRLQLYPFEPPASLAQAAAARHTMDATVYVLAADQVEGEPGFYSLFRFDGDLLDRGVLGTPLPAAAPVGLAPVFELLPDDVGYLLENSRSQLAVPRFLLPATAGALAPFSLSFELQAERASDASLLRTATADELTSFEVFFDQDGIVNARLAAGSEQALLSAAVDAMGTEPVRLTFSLTTSAAGVGGAWYRDGVQVAANPALLGRVPRAGEAGTTSIGATGGSLHAVLGELAVFARDQNDTPSADAALFAAVAHARYGERLRYVEGFDAGATPAAAAAGVAVSAGLALVPSGRALALPPLGEPHGELQVYVWSGNGLLTVSGDGAAPVTRELPLAPGLNRVSWQRADGVTTLAVVGSETEPLTMPAPAQLLAQITAATDAPPLALDHVLVVAGASPG